MPVLVWLLTSLLCLSLLLAHGYQKEIVGIMGENFTFPVQTDQKIEEIVWKKNKHKVAEWEFPNKTTYFGDLGNRSVLMENGSLTIVNLEKYDAGIYEFVYWDSMKEHQLNFILVVLDSLPKPEINCNTSDDELILNCTANFQASLNYTWKLSNSPHRYQKQELSIPLKNVDITINATCIIKYSQTERSSEISFIQCLPEEKGDSSHKRHRNILISFLIAPIIILVILEFLRRKGIIKLGRKTAQNNSPVNGSDRALNKNDRGVKDQQIVKNGLNQEEVTQDAEDENGVHLDSSSNCSKEDLKA